MLFQLFKTFLWISTLTVGGGAAMIPVINKEIVEKKQYMTQEEFLDALGIAQSVPGVLGCNISIIVGYKIKGIKGAIVCLICSILPAFLSILLIAIFFKDMSTNYYVNKFFIAVKPALVAVLASAVVILGKKTQLKAFHYVIGLVVLILVSYFKISPFLVIFFGGFGYILYCKYLVDKH